ncbi:MAG: hypothetical protein IT267_11215 [Saprospiraceae bacterium]|nr:hypothetical protein [Saprospiraceae bacterium]HNF32923.1 hypothetical protein [Bacteroidia bacterium]HNN11812.1 hypothetical protein [Bacteroidia bacterium]
MGKSLIFIIILISGVAVSAQDNCLFRNPLCFYNTDILTYLQVLHKNQQYEKMAPFFYGSFSDNNKYIFLNKLGEVDFGYTLKRVGVIEIEKNKWSLTYQRTIMGTNENFKIECALINDTCRVYLDEKQWSKIFK